MLASTRSVLHAPIVMDVAEQQMPAFFPPQRPLGRALLAAIAVSEVFDPLRTRDDALHKRSAPRGSTAIGYIEDEPFPLRLRRFALLAGLGAPDDLTDRRDENWLAGTGAALVGVELERRNTVAFERPFWFAVEGFAADLVGAGTIFFVADRAGATKCF